VVGYWFAGFGVVGLVPQSRRFAAERQRLRSLWWMSVSARPRDNSIQKEFVRLREVVEERVEAIEDAVEQLESDFDAADERPELGYAESPVMKALPPRSSR